jgi:hypothetical protein
MCKEEEEGVQEEVTLDGCVCVCEAGLLANCSSAWKTKEISSILIKAYAHSTYISQ